MQRDEWLDSVDRSSRVFISVTRGRDWCGRRDAAEVQSFSGGFANSPVRLRVSKI
jgi:hypothetical protein